MTYSPQPSSKSLEEIMFLIILGRDWSSQVPYQLLWLSLVFCYYLNSTCHHIYPCPNVVESRPRELTNHSPPSPLTNSLRRSPDWGSETFLGTSISTYSDLFRNICICVSGPCLTTQVPHPSSRVVICCFLKSTLGLNSLLHP